MPSTFSQDGASRDSNRQLKSLRFKQRKIPNRKSEPSTDVNSIPSNSRPTTPASGSYPPSHSALPRLQRVQPRELLSSRGGVNSRPGTAAHTASIPWRVETLPRTETPKTMEMKLNDRYVNTPLDKSKPKSKVTCNDLDWLAQYEYPIGKEGNERRQWRQDDREIVDHYQLPYEQRSRSNLNPHPDSKELEKPDSTSTKTVTEKAPAAGYSTSSMLPEDDDYIYVNPTTWSRPAESFDLEVARNPKQQKEHDRLLYLSNEVFRNHGLDKPEQVGFNKTFYRFSEYPQAQMLNPNLHPPKINSSSLRPATHASNRSLMTRGQTHPQLGFSKSLSTTNLRPNTSPYPRTASPTSFTPFRTGARPGTSHQVRGQIEGNVDLLSKYLSGNRPGKFKTPKDSVNDDTGKHAPAQSILLINIFNFHYFN